MTDLPYLASRLYGTPLLIARPKLEAILGVMARKMAGEPLAMPDSKDAATLQILEGIAVIPILGTLVRRSSYLHAASGLTGYFEIEAMAEQAFADQQVKAVLLEIDSSGGEAGGVFDLAQRLRRLAHDTGKPLWAIADEAALSAAYAIAAAADRVWLTQTAEAGSIGVVAVHVDVSAADAKAGLNYSFLHAGRHKIDGHPHAPLPEAVAADIQGDLDRLHDQFIALVAGFRRLTPEAVRATEARLYRGEAAIHAGLADGIGTTREALTVLARSLLSAGEDPLVTVMTRKLARMRAKHAQTLEYMRVNALLGVTRDGAGNNLYDWHNAFEIPKPQVDFAFGGAEDIVVACTRVARHIEENLKGETMTSLHALVSPEFFDALVKHKSVKEAYGFYQGLAGTNPLRDDVRRGFRFGPILFEEYFGTVTLAGGSAARLVPAKEGVAFPLGTLDTFRTCFAPANLMEAVGTYGQELYAYQLARPNSTGIDIYTQSNPLPIVKRPALTVRLFSANGW